MESYSVNINGLRVDATYSEHAVKEIFLPLLRRLTEQQKKKKGRIVVFLAAPPGAGKSTLAGYLEKLSNDYEDVCNIQSVGMDGFHRRQEYLTSHSVELDGKNVSMVEIKGAPITFDLEKLTEAIKRVSLGENISWPSYDRNLHNPVEGTYTVTENIILIEGNYLLLNEDGWRELRKYADYSIRITADEEFLRKRLIDRKVRLGHAIKKAEAFVDFSDMVNVRTCIGNSLEADMTLSLDDTGEYHSIDERKHFYFVRHGETIWNVENKICGATDIVLTAKGHEQAIETGKRILEEKIYADEILSSPLSRAYDTAKHISEITGIPLRKEQRLIEQNFGRYESTPRDGREFHEAKKHMASRFTSGESMLQLAQRIYNLLDDIKKDDKTYILVAHNGIARIVESYFREMDNEEFSGFGIKNCEIRRYDF